MTIVAFYGVSILKTKHEKAQKFDLAAITKLEVQAGFMTAAESKLAKLKLKTEGLLT